MKRVLGQQKAGFGDVVFDMATATRDGNVLTVRNAIVGEHAGQSTLWAATRLGGRRVLDFGLTEAIVTTGGTYVYNLLKGK